jgi:hypothetical protein
MYAKILILSYLFYINSFIKNIIFYLTWCIYM